MTRFVNTWVPIHVAVLLAAFLLLLNQSGMTFDMALGLWIFIPVGILGAIIANATGTGGGVVFVPVFLALKDGAIPIDPALQDLVTLTAAQTIAVSFTIQCFGMSVGSLNWARAIFVQNALAWYDQVPNATLMAAFTAPLALGIPALLLVQSFVVVNGDELIFYFKIFSLALGTVLLFFTWQQKRAPKSARRLIMTRMDIWALLGLGALGGAVTAVFSVGIGEFLAIYLILRRYPTTIAIAVAVWVSLVCVVVGFWDNFFAGLVVLPVALMAVIGAIIGGYLAKGIAGVLGPLWLKTAASIWIIASSLYLLLT